MSNEKKKDTDDQDLSGRVLVGLKHETNVSILEDSVFHGKLLLHFLKARPVLLDDIVTECLYDPELKSEMRQLISKIEESSQQDIEINIEEEEV